MLYIYVDIYVDIMYVKNDLAFFMKTGNPEQNCFI